MTDLTDEALDNLVAQLTDIGKFAIGGGTASDAAAVITALRQREAEAVAGAIEAAAHLVSATAYTSNGDRRSLEPVSKGLEGQDMHHATIATAIRALHTDATRAALDKVRAEGMREAVEIAHRMAWTDANMNRTWRAGCEDVAEAIHRAADKLFSTVCNPGGQSPYQ